METPNSAKPGAATIADGTPPPPREAPRSTARAAFARDLAGHLQALLEGGDLEGARLASSTLTALLGAGPGEGTTGVEAPVVDLESERRKRGR